MRNTALALICSLAASPAAGEFALDLPVDCALDDTCFIQQFVDHNPLPSAYDFQCGSLTYDGHRGTDFALPSQSAMAAGVAVLAAAPGVVVAVRNDMPDKLKTAEDLQGPSVNACGNGVVLRHENAWQTQYCHLAEGSVTVAVDQVVSSGDVLGMIGLSGNTQFPHLHFSVRRLGEVFDPFAPFDQVTCGQPPTQTLWRQDLPTPPGGLIATGFSPGVPDYAVIKAGEAHSTQIAADQPLVVWGYSFGGKAGDEIVISITGPNAMRATDTQVLGRTQAQLFRAFGKRAPDGGWPPGTYAGTVVHMRDGAVLDTQTTETTIIAP